ncbi:hypothetical protein DVH24_028116 [Malus domestica]|uniref:Fatty acid desaturase domain-containing protein n=1 Tax=Malus domestica TaxID=3750 RepID=A0A498HAD8_MALDO|nr:hypothetical protein DVH24_028116 [Malus domestica]
MATLFGLLAHGEGWHNNHHAFEYSARQGILQAVGLVTDVKLPAKSQKKRKALYNKISKKNA